jgi:hypothetical protein
MLVLCFSYTPGQSPTARAPQQKANSASSSLPDAAPIRSEIQAVEALLPRIPDRGAALFFLARRYARLGDPQKALALLKECMALDEGFDPGEAPAFESLRANPEFRQLVDETRRRHPVVHRASVAYTVPEKDLFPEGLAVDAEKHAFYMGSMHRKKIVKITESGEVSDFVKEGLYDLMPVGGVHVDPADHSIWAATDPGEKNRSEIVHFDAQGKLLERYTAPGKGRHDLNDLVLRGPREIYTTDTAANQVYRFDGKLRRFTALTLARPVFYPNGITLSGDGNLLYVADILGVLQMDLRSNRSQEVQPGQNSTLAGIDGLYWYKGDLLGVQYGTGAFRVMRWGLSRAGVPVTVTSSEVLEQRTDLVSFPTTGAIYGERFYFIANTGIGNLEDDKIVDPARLEPVHIAMVPLK